MQTKIKFSYLAEIVNLPGCCALLLEFRLLQPFPHRPLYRQKALIWKSHMYGLLPKDRYHTDGFQAKILRTERCSGTFAMCNANFQYCLQTRYDHGFTPAACVSAKHLFALLSRSIVPNISLDSLHLQSLCVCVCLYHCVCLCVCVWLFVFNFFSFVLSSAPGYVSTNGNLENWQCM